MADAYISQLSTLDKEIKRRSVALKQLRENKKKVEKRLADYMEKNGLEKYKTYTLKKLKPGPRKKRKPKKQQRAELEAVIRSIGYTYDPSSLIDQIEATRRY